MPRITYVLIERAIMSGRLTPFAFAIVSAAFTLGIQPTGLIAVAALIAGGRPILRILVRRRAIVGTWPLVAPLLAAGTVILTVVFADQTLATVLEATRIRTDIGPSQAWYTENLRYYYLILPTVDGSLSRRFGFLITALSLFISMFIMLRRKRVPGVARGPAWRLMGVIFATMFFLMFTPTKWVHHFGLFAAVGRRWPRWPPCWPPRGAALVAQPDDRGDRGFVPARAVLRDDERLVVRLELRRAVQQCDAAHRWNHRQHDLLRAVRGVGAVHGVAALALPQPRGGPHRADDHRGAHPLAAGFMVLVFMASMAAGVVRQYPTYSNAWANLRAFSGGCGLADDVLVEPDTNAGFLSPLPGDYGPLGPLGGTKPVGFTPNGLPEHIVAEAIRMTNPQPGTDYDWDQPIKLSTPGVNGSTVPLPYGLDPAGFRWLAATSPARSRRACSPRPGTSCRRPTAATRWWSSPPRAPSPATACSTRTPTASSSSWSTPGPARTEPRCPPGRVQPYDIGPAPSWRNLRYDRSRIPADATAVRIVAADRSLGLGDWIAVTPPRVPELRSVQEYVGSTQPVLMDWAVGLAFPCQQPMLHANGVTEVPKFRITPDYTARSGTPTPGRTAATAVCSGSPTCCCASA